MNKEGLPPEKTQKTEVRVDFVRHGETNYTENNYEKDKVNLVKIPMDLTEAGIQQIYRVGTEIADGIDPQKEVVILWSSPAWRAQGSESIIENILKERGIEIYRKSKIKSMSPLNKHSDNPEVNADEIMRKNTGTVFNWIRYMAENAEKMHKKLHIIGVAHHEFLNLIREDIFPFDVPKGQGFQKGESISIKFIFDKEKDELLISVSMRGFEVNDITFDKKTRKFVHSSSTGK